MDEHARCLALTGQGPQRIPHDEHLGCPDAETFITGIDHYDHLRQRLAVLYPHLNVDIPASDDPILRPVLDPAGQSEGIDGEGRRVVRWADGKTFHGDHGTRSPGTGRSRRCSSTSTCAARRRTVETKERAMKNDPFVGMPREEPLDWGTLARRFDAFVSDPANGVVFTNSRGEKAFTAFLEGDTGPYSGHELVSFGPIAIGRLLLGRDSSDLLPSLAGYFSEEAGIFLNHPGGMRIELWYLVYVISLAAHLTLTALRHDAAAMERVRRSLATLRAMAHRLGYNFSHQGYDFAAAGPWTRKGAFRQEDALGGYAYLMLLGHEHFGEPEWLQEAEEALGRYLAYTWNPWYEIPCGALAVAAAARLAARGRAVNVHRALDFVLDPDAGLVAGEWGGRQVNGLYRGWRHSTPESAYSLETLVALPLMLPAARAVPDLAPRLAAYALHTSANARLFYSGYTGGNESRADLSPDVPYERLYQEHSGKSPYAAGDFAGQKSVYGGACSLWWGALVHRTEVPHVLRLDVGSTDFLRPDRKPGWLYYNPWDDPKIVRGPSGEPVELSAGGVWLVGEA